MPHIDLPSSALVPGVSPVRVHYREAGSGRPMVIHGAKDPRTEPGELDAMRAEIGTAATFAVILEGGHSPHSERATADQVTRAAQHFLAALSADLPTLPAPPDPLGHP